MLKFNITFDQRKQRMVTAHTNMITRVDLCTALAHNNTARGNILTIVALHTKHIRVAIPAIAGVAHTLFMCHDFLFLCLTLAALTTFAALACLGILGFCCGAPACSLLLGLYFWSCFGFSHLRFRFGLCGHFRLRCFLLDGSSPLLRCFSGHQANAISNNIINSKNCQLLPVTTAVALALLGLIPENNQLLAATLASGRCQHHSIIY